MNLDSLIQSLLDDRRSHGRLRQRAPSRVLDCTHIEIDGRVYLNFCSNSYLGLTRHPRLIAAAQSALQDAGAGSGASALISGYLHAHAQAEAAIARWKKTESAVLLASGYQANLAAVQTFAAIAARANPPPRARFLVDKLVHASILDAIAATGAALRVFPHNNLAKLRRLLGASDAQTLDVVATESIFSMDGDAADLPGLAALKQQHPFALLLDEAHASGVYGPDGAGLAAELGLPALSDVSIVTLSKALGGIGGAICASRAFCEGVVNFGRAYIYSTSLPPSAAAAAMAAIDVLHDEPDERARLRQVCRQTRHQLASQGAPVLPGDSPIICIVIGSEAATMEGAAKLREEGLLVAAVRPPTVAPGSSRLRITLTSRHTADDLERLCRALKRVCGPNRD